MTISSHFYHISSDKEQSLMKDLTREVIHIRGLDFFYIPRDSSDADWLFGEDTKSTFTESVKIEMYPTLQDGFEGDGDFLAKFGVDIRDEIQFQIAKDRFSVEIKKKYPTILRPREGDLIYYPLTNSIFEIMFVEHERPFYNRGIQTTWEVNCKKFQFNRDEMDTGIAEIDDLNTDEPYDNNEEFQTEADPILNFDEKDPFSENGIY